MADVSKIKLTDNTEYDIKDAIARQSIATTDEKTTEIIEQLNNPTYTTTEGTDLSIDNTRVGKMKFEYYGDTEQETIGNLNRFNYTLSILKIRNASGTWSNNVYTNNSVTFTVNEDLTITVNGTASANTYFYLNASNDSYFKTLNGLTLKLTGTPTGGGNNTFQMTITSADWSNGTNDNGNGGQFTAIEDFYNNTYIRIANGYNCSNLTFKPMLSTTLTTTYNDYEQPTAGNGTPSPSYPSEVKTVTGENTINIVGRNRIKINDTTWSGAGSNALTYNIKDGIIRITGTAGSAGYSTYNITSLVNFNELNKIPNGMKITFSVLDITGLGANQIFIGKTGQQYWMQPNATTKKATVTKDADLNYMAIWFQTTQGQVYDITIKPMLVTGETAYDFEPYQSQSYELNLGVNVVDCLEFNTTTSGGITLTPHWSESGLLFIKSSGTFSSTGYFNIANNIKLQPNTKYTINKSNHSGAQYRLREYDANNTQLSETFVGASDVTITSNSNVHHAVLQIVFYTTVNALFYPQITKGTISKKYQPYFTPLELCKIGDYQDYIYNNGGKWFKHKEVGKRILNGTENWNSASNNYPVFNVGIFTDKVSGQGNFKCNNFSYLGNAQTTLLGYAMSFNTDIYSQFIYIQVPSSIVSQGDVAAFKSWISSNNTEVYYPLKTPTEEEITEPTLINQLNAIKYGAESYYGTTNIIITSEELQPVLKVQTMDKIV